jgi:phage I-like protein
MTGAKKRPPGRWKTGESGNPAGRKPGTGEVAKIRAAIASRLPELLDKLMALAMEGDTAAARLLLERAVAPLKAAEQPQALSLPNGTLTEQGRAVLAAVAAGELAPGQGAQLVAAIGTLARVAEIDELAARVAALENKHGNT